MDVMTPWEAESIRNKDDTVNLAFVQCIADMELSSQGIPLGSIHNVNAFARALFLVGTKIHNGHII
jgi:hypothetical protein